MQEKLAMASLRHICNAGGTFSIPHDAFLMIPLEAAMGGDRTPVPLESLPDHIFVTAVHSSAGQKATVKLPRAEEAASLRSGEWIICLQEHLLSHDGEPIVSISARVSSSQSMIIAEDAAISFELLQSESFGYDYALKLQYWLHGVLDGREQENLALTAALVGEDALPHGPGSLDITRGGPGFEAVLDLMAAGMLVDLGVDDGGGDLRVRLTDLGTKAMRYGERLINKRPLFAPRPGVALADRTVFECICLLHDQGFRWQRFPSDVARRQELIYDADSPKIWYSTGVQVPARYCSVDWSWVLLNFLVA